MEPSARNFPSAANVTALSVRIIATARPNADLMFLIPQLEGGTSFNTSAMERVAIHVSPRLGPHLGRAKLHPTIIPNSEFHRRQIRCAISFLSFREGRGCSGGCSQAPI